MMNVQPFAPLEDVDEKLAPTLLPFLSADSLAGQPIPPRDWYVDDLIPAGTVTMMNGDGGTGKSLLSLQLVVASVAGGYWAGRAVKPGAGIYLSAEDDLDELHRRLADIVAADDKLSLATMGKLTLLPLAGEDAVLGTFDAKAGRMKPTPLYSALEDLIHVNRASLVVLDSLADVFAGEENHRAQARQFIGLLRGLCARRGVTILVLAHPSLSGMASGSGMSGSTAWNNSVRSRLYFERLKANGDDEPDPDIRTLRTVKANYGKTGEEIRLRWQAGVFKPAVSGQNSFTAMAAQSKAERVFMSLLAAYTSDGRSVGHAFAGNFAPTLFARDPRNEGVTKAAFTHAMNALFAAGRIRNEERGPASRRRTCIVAVESHDRSGLM